MAGFNQRDIPNSLEQVRGVGSSSNVYCGAAGVIWKAVNQVGLNACKITFGDMFKTKRIVHMNS